MKNNETEKERIERYKKILSKIIEDIIPNAKIYLFGSRARLSHQEGSDIDLAIDSGNKIDIKTILKLHTKIEETSIPLSVDLIDFNNIKPELKNEIIKEGILWTK